MNFQRIFLFLIFSFSVFILWDGWQREQIQPVKADLKTQTPSSVSAFSLNGVPVISEALTTTIPKNSANVGEVIKVKTDFFYAEINTLGGDIRRIELLKHFDTTDKSKPFVIFQQEQDHSYIAQSGLLGADLPTHNTLFTSDTRNIQLSDNSDSVQVHLSSTNGAGVKVSKILVFHRSSYLIDVNYEIVNNGKDKINASAYYQLVRDEVTPVGGTMFVPTYTGPAVYTDLDKFVKVEFSAVSKNKAVVPKPANNGWAGMLQHYFVSAWLPAPGINREFFVKKLDDKLFSVGLVTSVNTIEPGSSDKFSVPLYVGPAKSNLDAIAPGLGLTVDYGFLTIIAKPLFWTLEYINGLLDNWGFSIILLTVLIKLIFFPLSAASYRSMAKMRIVAPKLAQLKEQFANDREKLNRAMMDLYKNEKINPLGGCLPVLIQIPVFISLYWAILSSVEMRYAPFIGWITDLSRADPYFVLPIIMGASMIIQGKLNPTPPDPIQAKMMQIMPIAFSVVFFFFPVGLVLYSVVNNILTIAQQWYITRQTEAADGRVNKS
jgi:YidC/Oxa1 family membrane protein insertase